MTQHDSNLVALMLPGFGCDLDSMLELVSVLESCRSIRHTQCEVLISEGSLDEMVSKLVDHYSHTELVLIGFSMGGWIAQELASRLGSAVKGIVLISSWTEAPSRYLDVIQRLNRDLRSGTALDSLREVVAEGFSRKQTRDALADRWLTMARRVGSDTFVRQTTAILEHPNVGHSLSGIHCPTLAIAGVLDTLLSPNDQFKWFQNRANFETVTLESCGHNLIWEEPSMVSRLVTQWLRSNVDS